MRIGSDTGGLLGDPAVAASAALRAAAHLRVVAEGLERAARLYPAWSAATWSGLAAVDALQLTQRQPARFRLAAMVFREAAEALSGHADRLRVAVAVYEAAGRAPTEAAATLRRQASELAWASGRELSARLEVLARRAPSEPSLPARVGRRLEAWHDEVAVGAGESTAAVIGMAARGAGLLRGVFSSRTPGEVRCAGAALAGLAEHPGPAVKALVDWDTWAHNPPRALGHLVPDLLGGSGGARAARVVASGRSAALQVAAARRLADEEAAALAARERLRAAALATAPEPGRAVWRGDERLRLPAPAGAVVERYHVLSMAAEARITATLRRVAGEAGGDLAGLETRRKALDSAYRKAAQTRGPVAVRLEELDDLVRYTVVADPRSYALVVGRVGRMLREAGFRARRPKNFWVGDKRYRGINTSWIDPASGVVFEVQFHTPATWGATKLTHPWYEKMRVLSDRAARAPIEARIKAEYDRAAVPPAATWWTEANYPPKPRWLNPPPVPEHARLAAAGAAAAPGLATAADR